MTSVPNKVLGYLKITGPSDNTLLIGPRFGRLSKNRDEVLLEITKRDTKKLYYYDDPTAKYFMPEPCWRNKRIPATDCGREIEVACGEGTCVAVFGTVNNNPPSSGDDFPVFPPTPKVSASPPSQQCPDGTVLPVEFNGLPPTEYQALCNENISIEIGGGGGESVCPEGYQKFGFNQGNPCHGYCCICGDVGHCLYVARVLAGWDSQGCYDSREDTTDPDSPQTNRPWEDQCELINPNPFCECPICDEPTDCENPYSPDCKKCNATRRYYESSFRVCAYKQVLACYQPEENGPDYQGMKFVTDGGTEILLEAVSGNFIPQSIGSDLEFTPEELEEANCFRSFEEGFPCPVTPPQNTDACEIEVEMQQGHCGQGYAYYPGVAWIADPVCPLGNFVVQQQVYPKLIFAWWKIGSVGNPNPGEEIGVLPVGEPPVGGPNLGGGHNGGNCPEQIACQNGCEDGLECLAYLQANSPENIVHPDQNPLSGGGQSDNGSNDCEPADIPRDL